MFNQASAPHLWTSTPTEIEGIRVINRPAYPDERGQFTTLFHVKHPLEGVPTEFAQENVSVSLFGVLRGMHVQKERPQGKLVTCLFGNIWDVWIDLRPESPTYLKGECLQLSSERMNSVYIPPGFGHGFITLSRSATVHYKTTEEFVKELDCSFRWDSPEVRALWPGEFEPIISDKDRFAPVLDEFLKSLS